jgi:hypothetical protein
VDRINTKRSEVSKEDLTLKSLNTNFEKKTINNEHKNKMLKVRQSKPKKDIS